MIIVFWVQENQGIAIWGFNSPYWMMASLGGMLSGKVFWSVLWSHHLIFWGGISMGIYPTDNPEIVAYKVTLFLFVLDQLNLSQFVFSNAQSVWWRSWFGREIKHCNSIVAFVESAHHQVTSLYSIAKVFFLYISVRKSLNGFLLKDNSKSASRKNSPVWKQSSYTPFI